MLCSLVFSLLVPPVSVDSSSHSDTHVCHRLPCLVPLSQQVHHCWQLSSLPHPLDPSSCTFNTRVLGTSLWSIQQPSYVGCRQYGLHLPSRPDLLTTVLLRNQHLQLHQRHLHPNQKPSPVRNGPSRRVTQVVTKFHTVPVGRAHTQRQHYVSMGKILGAFCMHCCSYSATGGDFKGVGGRSDRGFGVLAGFMSCPRQYLKGWISWTLPADHWTHLSNWEQDL